ncbi:MULTISPECIES: DMT family transporter [Pectobacterium]|uniref:DMT family transporter n=1 Tax=Pectobacterium jejuense TaxID=2974022 RepID=A0ABW8GZB0_9GAMM|nr:MULTISPECIES: DMT family transporter [Pectobacterium]MCY9848473.1 DMT family transporter [Pectobacterium jejuense]UMO87904.1 DMT family transporter [Pectobacterium sp. PL64]
MSFIYYFLAVSVGIAIATQSAVNNQLKSILGGSTMLAALISFIVGTLCLFFLCAASGERFNQLIQLRHCNIGLLSGGVLGAFFVFGTTFLAPRLGIAAMISLVIFGQISMSLLLDKFGLLGLPIREIAPMRLVGVLLVLAGVLCVNLKAS